MVTFLIYLTPMSFQILLADLRELRGVLDNLIWKGSELSASMRLKDLDIKDTLKQMEEKWTQAVQDGEKKLVDMDDLRMDWAEKEEMLVNMESWVVEAEDQLENERGLSSRDEESLREALAYYEVNSVPAPAVNITHCYKDALANIRTVSSLLSCFILRRNTKTILFTIYTKIR